MYVVVRFFSWFKMFQSSLTFISFVLNYDYHNEYKTKENKNQTGLKNFKTRKNLNHHMYMWLLCVVHVHVFYQITQLMKSGTAVHNARLVPSRAQIEKQSAFSHFFSRNMSTAKKCQSTCIFFFIKCNMNHSYIRGGL